MTCLSVGLAAGQCPIQLTEIQADPTPSRGLAEVEFLEVYVDSPDPIALQGWTLRVNSTSATFPVQTLLPYTRYVLIAESQRSRINWSAPTLGLSRLSLPNAGATLTIHSPDGPCSSVSYDPSWGKQYAEGGFSLELMNLTGACLGKRMWQSTESPQGGTPGMPPIQGEKPLPMPFVKTIIPDSTGWAIHFSQTMQRLSGDWNQKECIGNWVNETVFHVTQVPELDRWQRGTLVNWVDCTGQILADTLVSWGWFAPPQPGEWKWTEILVAPTLGSQGFIEIKSEAKVPRLWPGGQIQYMSNTSTRTVEHTIPSRGQILSPGETWAFTGENPSWELLYQVGPRVDSLPGWADLANAGGQLSLVLGNGLLIHQVVYSEAWHHPLISANLGRSWQRFESNWSPTPTLWGLATPGWEPNQVESDETWRFDPAYLSAKSPEAMLYFRLPSPDFVLTASLVDAYGHLIYRYPESQTWPVSGAISWKFPNLPGKRKHYYLHLHGFHPDGRVFQKWIPFIWEFD